MESLIYQKISKSDSSRPIDGTYSTRYSLATLVEEHQAKYYRSG